jgi:hypothetical protein
MFVEVSIVCTTLSIFVWFGMYLLNRSVSVVSRKPKTEAETDHEWLQLSTHHVTNLKPRDKEIVFLWTLCPSAFSKDPLSKELSVKLDKILLDAPRTLQHQTFLRGLRLDSVEQLQTKRSDFTSTTLYHSIDVSHTHFMAIKVQANTPALYVAPISAWKRELEVLLPRNTTVSIQNAQHDNTIECTLVEWNQPNGKEHHYLKNLHRKIIPVEKQDIDSCRKHIVSLNVYPFSLARIGRLFWIRKYGLRRTRNQTPAHFAEFLSRLHCFHRSFLKTLRCCTSDDELCALLYTKI